MFEFIVTLSTYATFLCALGFFVAVIASTVSKRARHFLNCGNHTMKVCRDKRVFLVCYDCGLPVSKGWNLEHVHDHPAVDSASGHRPDGLRLSFDSSWPGPGLRGSADCGPGGEVA